MRRICNLLALVITLSLASTSGGYTGVAASDIALWQEPPPTYLIAAPFPGETAFEMVGRSEHHDSSITSYGFLSSVAGIDKSMVFSASGAPSAATARFTYFSQLEHREQSIPGDVSVTDAEGTLTIYFSEDGGSDLDVAESFFRGDPVATMQIQLQDIHHQVEGTDSGVTIGEGSLTQVFDAPFSFDGDEHRFGQIGLQERFLLAGTIVADGSSSSTLMTSVAGHATVSGRQEADASSEAMTETSPAREGEQVSAVDASCEGVETWLAEAVANAEQAEGIISGIPSSASIQSLDPAAVSDAIVALADLTEAQRSAEVPDLGLSANQLLVTALSTYSRGATLVEDALADGDEEALSQALDILQDGDELTSRALDQIMEVGTSCGVDE